MQFVERHVVEDAEFGPVGGDEVGHGAEDLLALGPDAVDLADDLRQRDEVAEPGGPGRADAGGAVGEVVDAVLRRR
ncbi:hypothetical protein [Saccharopolyspora sp. 7B]|uniref:hypothetical protein n=1 Tax=Saccharopolyspora sp. 7B TaxID=2877240 RepID=UPI001CD49B32|nr:hypothetical protein [Saccharopolyspora sp. 7B]MCA1282799.1 hypothetical protein [Saccharopolyspora sp. 7B]